MARKIQRRIILALVLLTAFLPLCAQNEQSQSDSLVRLVKASSIQLLDIDGEPYRKAVDATFLHNGTYLICDSALWNVDKKVINAYGHVQLIQDETILTSDMLTYLMDMDLAQFRGGVVQLQDKKMNTLRTHYLDYNTKDSIAVFRNGAAMKDKDGQIIESLDGTYSSIQKLFTFKNNVNMFSDSIFVRTEVLDFDTNESKAYFRTEIDFWRDDKMLSSKTGWYDKNREVFFFEDNVHGLSDNQEMWSDTLFYYRNTSDLDLMGRAQLKDTSRNMTAMGDRVEYNDSSSTIKVVGNAAIAMLMENKQKQLDTMYIGARELYYYTVPRNQIPQFEMDEANRRISDMAVDAVEKYRENAAIAAKEAAAKARDEYEQEKFGSSRPRGKGPDADPSLPSQAQISAPADSLPSGPDSLSAPADSLVAPTDSLQTVDSTKVGFVWGKEKVRLFRKDLQAICDSLRYSELDSMARLFIDPVIWSDTVQQFTADSIFLHLKNNVPDKASLMSNANVNIEQMPDYYDQIKALEIIAFFDTTGALRRFDALGGIQALFYLQEKGTLATANIVNTKIMFANLADGQLEKIHYFENPQNDVYPSAQLTEDQKKMKGFRWLADLRPEGKEDITSYEIKPNQKDEYYLHPKSVFVFCDKYYPGYMKGIYKEIELRDSLKRLPPSEIQPLDSIAPAPDSLGVKDTLLKVDETVRDTLAAVKDAGEKDADVKKTEAVEEAVKEDKPETKETVEAAPAATADSPKKESVVVKGPSKAQIAFELREKARLEKWAELDRRDSLRNDAKQLKKLEKKRAKTLKFLVAKQKQDEKDNKKLARFIAKYEKLKARREARKRKSSGYSELPQMPSEETPAEPIPSSREN